MSGSSSSVQDSNSVSVSVGVQTQQAKPRRSTRMLWLVVLVCAAPVLASYFMYYVVRPEGRTNYGELIAPPRDLPASAALAVTNLQGQPVSLQQQVKGNWLLLTVDSAACAESCKQKLYWMRQLKTAQGKEKERVDRVLFITDSAPLETVTMREYEGTVFLRAGRDDLARWLPTGEGAQLEDHIFVMDPFGNVMMRYPKNADANKIKRDISKLLRASTHWHKESPPKL